MARFRRTALVLTGAFIAVVVAACGSASSGGAPATSATVTSGAATVTIENFAFSPATLTVNAGTKVTWVNEDSVDHTATGSGTSAIINSPHLAKGQRYSVTLTKPGTYHYICTIHPNMTGTVIVR